MIRRGLLSALVLAFAASSLTTTRAFCAPAVSASGPAFERGDDFSGWLPFEFFGGTRIFVTVKVNGHPVKAMLDSGASATVIDGRFAETLGLRPHGDAAGDGAGGGGRYGEVEGVKLGLRDMTITAHPAVVIDLADVERQLGHPLPIILGGEVFRQSVVDIDFPRRRIAFRDPARFKAPAEAQPVVLTPAGEGEAITAIVEERPAKLLFDLGNGSALSLTPRFWDRPDFLRGRRVSSTLSGGWGGMSVRGLTLIGDLTLAGSSFNGLPATLDHGAAQGAGQTSLDGNVGIAVLNRFHLIVDFPHERAGSGAISFDLATFRPSLAWSDKTTSTPLSSACALARLSGLAPVATTVAPSSLKSRAVAAPIPVVPPVTRATLPASLVIALLPYR